MVSLENDTKMKNMKVFKSCAKSRFTKGNYKQSIYVKEDVAFKNRIPLVTGNQEKNTLAEQGDSGSSIYFNAIDLRRLPRESACSICFCVRILCKAFS